MQFDSVLDLFMTWVLTWFLPAGPAMTCYYSVIQDQFIQLQVTGANFDKNSKEHRHQLSVKLVQYELVWLQSGVGTRHGAPYSGSETVPAGGNPGVTLTTARCKHAGCYETNCAGRITFQKMFLRVEWRQSCMSSHTHAHTLTHMGRFDSTRFYGWMSGVRPPFHACLSHILWFCLISPPLKEMPDMAGRKEEKESREDFFFFPELPSGDVIR